MKNWLCCFLFLFLFPSFVFADNREDPVSGISDVGTDYPLLSNEIPGMVLVLTHEQIRIRGYRSIGEILRDLPSFTTQGGFDQSPNLFSVDGEQSLFNEKFLLFIDGVLEQDLWGRSIWLSFQYSVLFIKNITVFYGPAATRFGANAMSGVIFIDTKKAEDLENYGMISFGKDVRNNTWEVDFMLGHSYTRRGTPQLAKSLFSWYLRGKFSFSEESNSAMSSLWNPDSWDVNASKNQSPYYPVLRFSGKVLNDILSQYRGDYLSAYPTSSKGALDQAVSLYQNQLFGEITNNPSGLGNWGQPSYLNRNISYNAELGIRFDNWFLRFFTWGVGTGQGLQSLPIHFQSNRSFSWVQNFVLSLHHLKSELWSSGVGEKAKVIYFNLNLTYRNHTVPGNSVDVRLLPYQRTFEGRECIVFNEGTKTVPCTWNEYLWTPIYRYVVSNSFRVEPQFDFRLFEGKWKFSIGLNAGMAFLQGKEITSTFPEPQLFSENASVSGAGNQYDHSYISVFFQNELKFTSWFWASFGLRSDWDWVRGRLEEVANCERALFPCYRFSSPLVGRGSLIFKPLSNLQMRMSYGYAFLSPSNQQLFHEGVDTTIDSRELLPQDKHSLELNVTSQIKKTFFFSWSVFHHWLHNINSILVLPYKDNENKIFNIGSQETLGTRFYSIVKFNWWMSMNTSFTLLYPRLRVRRLNESVWLRDFPTFQAALLLDWKTAEGEKSHFFGSVRIRFQTSRQNTGFNQKENGEIEAIEGEETGPQAWIDLSFGYFWKLPASVPFFRKVTFLASVQNLLNLTQFDLGIQSGRAPQYNPLVPFPGINGFFRVSTDF